jgi:hypothetical protein
MKRTAAIILLPGCVLIGHSQTHQSDIQFINIKVTFAADNMPELPPAMPIPTVPSSDLVGSVPVGDPQNFPEVKMDFPMATGPFEPTWNSISKNYSTYPKWLRVAKFGIWFHFGPQAAPVSAANFVTGDKFAAQGTLVPPLLTAFARGAP